MCRGRLTAARAATQVGGKLKRLQRSMSKSLGAVRRMRESNSPATSRSDQDAAFHGIREDGRGCRHAATGAVRRDGRPHRRRAVKGAFLDGGGLYGTEDAVNFVVRQGEVSRVDGPFAEAKEIVGGWAIMQYDTLEEAVTDQQEFAELHAKHWPEVTVISTLRQISDGPEAPGN